MSELYVDKNKTPLPLPVLIVHAPKCFLIKADNIKRACLQRVFVEEHNSAFSDVTRVHMRPALFALVIHQQSGSNREHYESGGGDGKVVSEACGGHGGGGGGGSGGEALELAVAFWFLLAFQSV